MSREHDELLEELRPAAFAIAYRMLGSVAEAEDVVQEALLRLHRTLEGGERIESPRAYVATVGHPAGHRSAALRACSPRDLPRRVAAGAARERPVGRPGPPGRDGRLALDGVPGAARDPVARAARRAPPPRRVRLRLRRRRAH